MQLAFCYINTSFVCIVWYSNIKQGFYNEAINITPKSKKKGKNKNKYVRRKIKINKRERDDLSKNKLSNMGIKFFLGMILFHIFC